MPKVTLYHNPKCSKSRQTLALLREKGVEPTVIEYLKHPPTRLELVDLLKKLKMKARDLMRSKEALFSELGLSLDAAEKTLVAAMVYNPRLIERPIVVCGDEARLGRPPEQILEIVS